MQFGAGIGFTAHALVPHSRGTKHAYVGRLTHIIDDDRVRDDHDDGRS